MRDYILILLAVFGICTIFATDTPINPEINTDTQVISTITLPELGQVDEISLDTLSSNAEITAKPIATTKTHNDNGNSGATLASAPIPTYRVTQYSADIVEHPNYSSIYKTGKLVYAHNTSKLFGNLKNLSVGDTFNLVESGSTTTYKVSDIKIFEKNPNTGKLQLNGSGDYMGAVVRNAFYHQIALMTCTGTSYGNGDASHRLVIFADQI